MTGRVSIVGAGPGDPELLTMRALARLRQADLVLCDLLGCADLRALAPRARWLTVGRRAGQAGTPQAAIHAMLISAARRGLRVVRLKGGDPFVFGRGAEERAACAAAGLEVEIVPGLSAALAGPASVGIPVTERGSASAFVVVSGHDPCAFEPVLGSLAPGSATVVVLMGGAQRGAIARALLRRGWKPTTPTAAVFDAFTEQQACWTGTLEGLELSSFAEHERQAVTLVIGTVAGRARATLLRAGDARAPEAATSAEAGTSC